MPVMKRTASVALGVFRAMAWDAGSRNYFTRLRPFSRTNKAALQGLGRSSCYSDRAVEWFLAPREESGACCLFRGREAAPPEATRHHDSRPILRRSEAYAGASNPPLLSRVKCENWTRNAPLHSPRAARYCISLP